MRDMNRRLALTVASTSAIVVITAGAAVAANLGILSASPSSGVGQLDATRVAELAVATPASIEATQVTQAPEAVVGAPGAVQPQTTTSGQVSTESRYVAPSATSVTPTTPTSDPQVPETRLDDSGSEDEDEYESEYESEQVEGSLDDHVQDDSIDMDSPRTLEAVVVSETDS